jgi:thiamine-phosphate pyrophosphorylase
VIVHLVTDRRRLVGGAACTSTTRECLMQQIRYAVDAGIDLVQIRERDLDARELSALVRDAVACARGTPTRIVVNDRADVALACGAAGVHLRSDSAPASSIRAIAPAGFLIGQSVHSVAEARAACAGADYLIAGTVWRTASKPEDHPLLGVDGFAAIAAAVAIPVLAIGGVSIGRARELVEAGASGIAAIGLFIDVAPRGCRSVNLKEIVAALRGLF